MCLICRETIAVFKEHNVKRHYEIKHNENDCFSEDVESFKIKGLEQNLKAQQSMFTSSFQQSSTIVKASYSVALLIEKKLKPFLNGEIVKECLEAVIQDVLPVKSKLYSTVGVP